MATERLPIPFVGEHATSRASQVNNQITKNLYVERQASGAKHGAVLYPTPGLKFLFSAGTGPCRSNGIVFKNKAYFISGADIVEIDSSLQPTTIGQLNTTTGQCKFAANPNHWIVVDGTDGWTYDGTTLTQITDGDFPTCNHVTFIDSFFIVEDRDNIGRFYKSGANDGQTWATLDFATAESHPDDLRVPYALNTVIGMFGDDTTEFYGNTQNPDFPFGPIRSSRIEYGVQADNSVIKAGDSLFWLARNKEGANMVLRSKGGQASVVSNRSIESEINSFSVTSDCVACAYQTLGHTFVEFSFPTAKRTFAYDLSENTWITLASKDVGRHRKQGHVFYQGKCIVGDFANSNFYQMDVKTYTDNGDYIERTRSAQFVHKDRKMVSIPELEIEFIPGVGLTTGQGSDPQVILSVSKDGGKTWSHNTYSSIGKLGEYNYRARWFQLGIAREWQFKVTISDPVFAGIAGAYAVVDVRSH